VSSSRRKRTAADRDWRPLHARRAGIEEALFDDAPAHLLPPLVDWFSTVGDPSLYARIALRLRIPYQPPKPRDMLDSMSEENIRAADLREAQGFVMAVERTNAALVLDAVDMVLHEVATGRWSFGDAGWKIEIARILDEGGSLWTVSKDGDALEERVLPAARDQLTAVDRQVGSAGEHIDNAWRAAYGRTPNASRAYSEAIKAVEAAAAPVVSPKNLKATLGTIRGDLTAAKDRWNFAIASAPPGHSIDVVLALIGSLWEGQSDRHGGTTRTRVPTDDAARAAVHMAITLVQWFQNGAIRPSP
jgi:hypothetical protein